MRRFPHFSTARCESRRGDDETRRHRRLALPRRPSGGKWRDPKGRDGEGNEERDSKTMPSTAASNPTWLARYQRQPHHAQPRHQQHIRHPEQPQRAPDIGRRRPAPSAVAHEGVVAPSRRHSCAGRRARGPARRPSPLPASRRWASGAFSRRARPRAMRAPHPCPAGSPPQRQSAAPSAATPAG